MALLSNMERRGFQQGFQQGTRETFHYCIIAILQKRFGTVSEELIKTINQIEEIRQLQELLLETVSVSSLKDFQMTTVLALKSS